MNVKNLKPNPEVSEYVERILVVENTLTCIPFSLPLFANGTPTLLFISVKGRIGQQLAAHLTLFGQTLTPELLRFSEGFELIAYFFRPSVLNSMFGIMAPEITDKPIDLQLLIPGKTKELKNQLLNEISTTNRLRLLDRFIAGLAEKAKKDDPVIRYAVHKVQQDPSPQILRQVQLDLHLTERTFQRIFEKHIGLSPNVYRRVCQFNAAFQQLNGRKFQKLSDLAFQNGYADQSHFVRAFREFTHLRPGEYLGFGSR